MMRFRVLVSEGNSIDLMFAFNFGKDTSRDENKFTNMVMVGRGGICDGLGFLNSIYVDIFNRKANKLTRKMTKIKSEQAVTSNTQPSTS